MIILLLTVQSHQGTVRFSEGLRLWLERFEFHSGFHSFRSNAHIILYFLFGFVLCLYGRERGWNWWIILLLGCAVGLIDESIKFFLPTREFDVVDLAKDWIGVAMATFIIWLLKRRKSLTKEWQ